MNNNTEPFYIPHTVYEDPFPQRLKKARSSFSWCGFSIAIGIGAFLVIQILFSIVYTYYLTINEQEFDGGFANTLLLLMNEFLMLPSILLLMLVKKGQKPEKGKFSILDFFKFMVISFPLMYAGSILGTVLSFLFTKGNATNSVNKLFSDFSIVNIIIIVAVAPVLEELVFRKFIIDRTAVYNEKCAVLFSALCFSLFHVNLFQSFYTFAVGLIWGYVYVRSGKIHYTIIMHSVMNLFGGVISPLVLSLIDVEKLQEISKSASPSPEQLSEILVPILLNLVLFFFIFSMIVFGIVLMIITLVKKQIRFLPGRQQLKKGDGKKALFLNPGVIVFICLTLAMTAINLFS